MSSPYVLSIAGSDSCGGAGIQADIKTVNQLGCRGASVITAVTAQNHTAITQIAAVDGSMVTAQLDAVMSEQMPDAIKVGMLYSQDIMMRVADCLKTYSGVVVCDPVLAATSGVELLSHKDYFVATILPHVDLLTPNLDEAMQLTGEVDIKLVASKLLSYGVKAVLIKGGHSNDTDYSHDYYTDGDETLWVSNYRLPTRTYHGSGCVLSAAIAVALAQGYSLKDALVFGRIYVTQGIRHTIVNKESSIICSYLQHYAVDLPWISNHAQIVRPEFPKCPQDLGLYPVVPSVSWIEKLLPLGIKTIQLRIKNQPFNQVEQQIKQAVVLANHYNARLFINDYWQLAIKYQAYGVHLGQEDIQTADINAIHQAGLFLGISSHCYYEVAIAHSLRPSYIACGPIFHTDSKQMSFLPQGTEALLRWKKLLANYPLVAIGGISLANISGVLKTGIKNIAVISAITQADDYQAAVKKLLYQF